MSNLILGPHSDFNHASVVHRISGKVLATVEYQHIDFEEEAVIDDLQKKEVIKLLDFYGYNIQL